MKNELHNDSKNSLGSFVRETNKKAVLFRMAYSTAEKHFLSRWTGSPCEIPPKVGFRLAKILQGKAQKEAQYKIDKDPDRTRKEKDDENEQKQSVLLQHEDGPFFEG